MALAMPVSSLVGSPQPRVAPPLPLQSDVEGFRDTCAELGIVPMPWQETSARYTEATRPDGRHLYPEVCEVVCRQNGKTEKLVPLIVKRLRAGRRIMHTAQNRDLPREVFARVADIMSKDETLFPSRNGRVIRPRFANGQEEIQLTNGGRYKIVAPTRGGARGGTNDDVIVDEVREMDSFEFIGAAEPTLVTSPDPQILYLSNMGDEDSIVLNSIRERATSDPSLAYLEWSAAPERAPDDPVGWAEGNPAIGHMPTMLEYLSRKLVSYKLAGTMAIFETEHLGRSVISRRESLVSIGAWNLCESRDPFPTPVRPVMAVSMDPGGRRASAVMAWRLSDDTIAMQLLYDVPGAPLDTDALGKDLSTDAKGRGVINVGFDPMSDAQLSRYFLRKEPLVGQRFSNATARFVELVMSGKLRWHDAAAVTVDLSWTTRKPQDDSGTFQAVRAQDDRPITAALAAIRAVWLASEPVRATDSPVPSAMGY
jgi:hypothetical protein